MKTNNEIRTIAATIVANAKSASEIKAQYAVLAEQYDKATARLIVDKARELRKKEVAKLDDRKNNILATVDRKALEWAFAGLLKEKDYKALAYRAMSKCSDVVEFVARWYPHTIQGVPAHKTTVVDGEGNPVLDANGNEQKQWTVKSKYNPQSVLKACLKQLAKSAKGAKGGTTLHAEGEIVPAKQSK